LLYNFTAPRFAAELPIEICSVLSCCILANTK
jgi:hypothetical protein